MFERLKRNTQGGTATSYIIELVVAVFLVAYLLPPAIVALTNTTSWIGAPAAIITLGTTVLGILIVLGIALALMPKELKGRAGF